tara:strand:+ start:288 stop:1127 length:840 start_codon:yes stop_codon:yes gene_type:complete
MENDVFFIVLLATIMHAIWNAMVKKHPDKTIAVSGIVLGHVPLALLAIIFLPMPSLKSLPYILASAIIHQGYQWYLLSAYKIGDFTKVYPICRGFGPIIATVISLIFLGVVFDLPILFSILLISFGIMLLGLKSESNNNFDIIKYSLLTGCFIGTYSIIDGYGARISLSAISYMSWSFVLNALMFPFLLKLRNETKIISRIFKNGKLIFWVGGSLSFIIYIIVIWGFTKAPIPMVAALRETSIFFSIFIGYFFLNEKITPAKIFSVLLILAGVVGLKLF